MRISRLTNTRGLSLASTSRYRKWPAGRENHVHRYSGEFARARRAVLHIEPYGRNHSRQTRKNLRFSNRFLSGDGALSRFAQSPQLPLDGIEARPALRYGHGLQGRYANQLSTGGPSTLYTRRCALIAPALGFPIGRIRVKPQTSITKQTR